MSALQIKCYLISAPSVDMIAKSNEIRRFVLAPSMSGFYAQLVDKIQQAFGTLLLPERDEIKTYWLDDENEMVCFSTDGELQYAVDVYTALNMSSSKWGTNSSVFKVYVVKNELSRAARRQKMRAATKEEEKVASSEDTTDEAKVLHPGVICDGCQKEIYGPRYKCKQCVDYDLCSLCKEKNIHNEHEFDKIPKPVQRCPFWTGTQPMDAHAWRHWRHHWRQHMRQQQQQQYQQQQQQRSTQSMQETINSFMPHIASSIPIVNNPEQLKNVGEYLKQFLDPFGIDVSYYVDSLNRNNNNEASKSTTNASSASNAEAKTEENKVDEEKVNEKKPEAPTPMQTEEKKTEETSKNVAETVVEASVQAAKTDVAEEQKTKEANILSPFEAAASALKNVIENQNADIPKIKASTTSTNDQEYNGFNLVDVDKEVKFIDCIEQLKAMGYSDDGGWLTRLVIAKDGNINAVLDTFHPTKN